MRPINKEICALNMAKGKWTPVHCALCSMPNKVGGRMNCENYQNQVEKEAREIQEHSDRFDETRELVRTSQEDPCA